MELKEIKRLANNKKRRDNRKGYSAKIQEEKKIKKLQEEFLAKRGN